MTKHVYISRQHRRRSEQEDAQTDGDAEFFFSLRNKRADADERRKNEKNAVRNAEFFGNV